ncbi:hypothetical protein PG988_000030 [Apiospora saccharicola]
MYRTALSRRACLEAGIAPRQECAAGDKDGLCWIPASQHPWAAMRLHSGRGHYKAVIEDRPNYDLLVRHQVTRVVYPDNDPRKGSPTVEIRSLLDEDAVFTKRPIRPSHPSGAYLEAWMASRLVSEPLDVALGRTGIPTGAVVGAPDTQGGGLEAAEEVAEFRRNEGRGPLGDQLLDRQVGHVHILHQRRPRLRHEGPPPVLLLFGLDLLLGLFIFEHVDGVYVPLLPVVTVVEVEGEGEVNLSCASVGRRLGDIVLVGKAYGGEELGREMEALLLARRTQLDLIAETEVADRGS